MASLADAISIDKFNQQQAVEEARALVNRSLDQAAIAQVTLFNLGVLSTARQSSMNPTEVHFKAIVGGEIVWRKVLFDDVARGQIDPWARKVLPDFVTGDDSEAGTRVIDDDLIVRLQRGRYQNLYDEFIRNRLKSVDPLSPQGDANRLRELIELEKAIGGNGNLRLTPEGFVNEGARQRIAEYEKDLRAIEGRDARRDFAAAEAADRRRELTERAEARRRQNEALKNGGDEALFERRKQEIERQINDAKLKGEIEFINRQRLEFEQNWRIEQQRLRKGLEEQTERARQDAIYRQRMEEDIELLKMRKRIEANQRTEQRDLEKQYERDRVYQEQQEAQRKFDAQKPVFWNQPKPDTPEQARKRLMDTEPPKPRNFAIPRVDPEVIERREALKKEQEDAYTRRQEIDELDRKGQNPNQPKRSEPKKPGGGADYSAWDPPVRDYRGQNRGGQPVRTPNEPGSGDGGVQFPRPGQPGGGSTKGNPNYAPTPDPWTASGQKFGDNGQIKGGKSSQQLPGHRPPPANPNTASETQRQPSSGGVGVADRPRANGSGVKGRMPTTPVDNVPRPYQPDFNTGPRPLSRRQSGAAGGLDAVGAVNDALRYDQDLKRLHKGMDYERALQKKYGLTPEEYRDILKRYRPDHRSDGTAHGTTGDVTIDDFDPYGPGGYEDMIKANRRGMSPTRFRRDVWKDGSIADPMAPSVGGLVKGAKKLADDFQKRNDAMKAAADKQWAAERKKNREFWDHPDRLKPSLPRRAMTPDWGDWPPFDPFGFPPGGGAPILPRYLIIGWIADLWMNSPGWVFSTWESDKEPYWKSFRTKSLYRYVFKANPETLTDMAPPTVVTEPYGGGEKFFFSHPDGFKETSTLMYYSPAGPFADPQIFESGTYIESEEELAKRWGVRWNLPLNDPLWQTASISEYTADRFRLEKRGKSLFDSNQLETNWPSPRTRQVTFTAIQVDVTRPGVPQPIAPPLNQRDPKPLPRPEDEPMANCRYAEDVEVPTPISRFDWATGRPKTEVRMVHKGVDDAIALVARDVAELSKNVYDLMRVLEVKEFNSIGGKVMLPAAQAKVLGGLTFAQGQLGGPVPVKTLSQEMALWAGMNHILSGHHMLGKTSFPANMADPTSATNVRPGNMLSHSQWQFNQVTNLIGIPNKQSTLDPTGKATPTVFKNQADAIETVNAQATEIKQDVSGIEEYLQKMAQQNEQLTQMVFQLGKDVECLMKDAGFKTKQEAVQRPSVFTHGKVADRGTPGKKEDDFSWAKTFELSKPWCVVRVWDDKVDKFQLGNKIHMEAQKAALSNFYPISKNAAYIPTLRSKAAKTVEENDWKKWVFTTENPGPMRQDGYSPVPDIEEIKLGVSKEINTADVTGRIGD